MSQQSAYKLHFEEYKKIILPIDIDLRFWKHFLSYSIKQYKFDHPVNTWINEAGYSAVNISSDGLKTWLYHSNDVSTIEIKDLDLHSDNFFIWIMNLTIVRVYNAVELLLFQSIRQKYLPALPELSNRKNITKLVAEMRIEIEAKSLKFDTTNNKHIVQFIRSKSPDFDNFLQARINNDPKQNWKTTWIELYEFFSVLRNVVTHHAMIVDQHSRNNLNQLAKPVFHKFFLQPTDSKSEQLLTPNNQHDFLNVISYVNDFTINAVKFIAEEPDLVFLGLKKASPLSEV